MPTTFPLNPLIHRHVLGTFFPLLLVGQETGVQVDIYPTPGKGVVVVCFVVIVVAAAVIVVEAATTVAMIVVEVVTMVVVVVVLVVVRVGAIF